MSDSKKRNRSEISTSEVDSSINESPIVNPKKKQSKKKQKDNQENMSEKSNKSESDLTLQTIKQELCQINLKLANVMQKDDGSIRTIIRETISEMKEELLKSVEKKIDILESRLFDKETENDKLKEKINRMDKQLEMQCNENKDLRAKLNKTESKTEKFFNKTEQYSRLNNLRINGINEQLFDKYGQQIVCDKDGKRGHMSTVNDEGNREVEAKEETKVFKENADQTTNNVITVLNKNIPGLNLKECDIDMCHRLGKAIEGRPRQVIVKFTSRLLRNKVYRLKKNLQRPIFITEDLTKLNHQVYLSVKSKQPDEIERCWTTSGDIYYRNKVGNVHKVEYNDYDMWLDMPWPK